MKSSKAEASKESALSTTDVNKNLQYTDDPIVDSGATVHMTSTGTLLEEPKSTPYTSISTVHGAYIPAISEGSSTVRSGTKKSVVKLNRILYVPQISEDLISVSQIFDAGCHVTFDDGKCVIYRGDEIVGEGYREGNIYLVPMTKVDVEPETRNEEEAHSTNDENMWYQRLGHINSKGIKRMVTYYIVRRLDLRENQILLIVRRV